MPLERVLVLCAANRCRSPLFAAVLRAELARVGAGADVDSAGFGAPGHAAAPGSVDEAAARGLDVSAHRSRRVRAADLRAADLVLTMELAQLRDAVSEEPTCWPRAFTVRGLARRAATAAPPGADLAHRVAALHAGRRAGDLLRAGTVDDVPDPMGRSALAFRQMGAEFDVLAPAVARFLTG